MEREQRLRFIGFLFYAVLVLHLAFTVEGTTLLRRVLSDQHDSAVAEQSEPTRSPGSEYTDYTGLVPALLGLGLVFFSSEAFGFLVSSIITALWNACGGYSGLWRRKLGADLRAQVVKLYVGGSKSPEGLERQGIFSDRLQEHSTDVLLNYFWQTCPERLVLWQERRVTAFFVGLYAVFAILLANILALVLARAWLGVTLGNIALVVVSVLFIIAIACNVHCSCREMWQMIDLWQGRLFDPNLHCALRTAGQTLAREELSANDCGAADPSPTSRFSPAGRGRPSDPN